LKKYFYDEEIKLSNDTSLRTFNIDYGEQTMIFLPFINARAEMINGSCTYNEKDNFLDCKDSAYFSAYLQINSKLKNTPRDCFEFPN